MIKDMQEQMWSFISYLEMSICGKVMVIDQVNMHHRLPEVDWYIFFTPNYCGLIFSVSVFIVPFLSGWLMV